MKKKGLKIINQLIFFLFISLFLYSCEKQIDTIGIIKVVKSNGQSLQGATVKLNQTNTLPGTDPISGLSQTKQTDINGKAQFYYQNEAILDVLVTTNIGNELYEGSGVIRLLRGKTEEVTIEVVKQ
tara:strand:- start:11013 stop:11390 length:378 start_codon:yes stop_codon:yes gene_type:complete